MDAIEYVVNVEGAVVRDDEYLLVERAADEEHAGGLLSFPGGKVEQSPGGDRPIEETARRELAEEIGIEVGDVAYVHSHTFETDEGTRCLDVLTCCEHVGGEPFPRAEDEVAAVHWVTREEIEAREDAPWFTERAVARVEEFLAAE